MRHGSDYELEALLSLDGQEFDFAEGHIVKYEVRRIPITKQRPGGVKYSLTLHDPSGKRIYGMDNAHRLGRHVEFDHRHTYGTGKVVAYAYQNPVALLEDFLREVQRILNERGVL